MIERYAFIKEAVWIEHQHVAPNAINVNGYRLIQYASPLDSDRLLALVYESGLQMVHHLDCTFDIVVSGIDSGDNKIFNCSHDVASRVCGHFNKGELL